MIKNKKGRKDYATALSVAEEDTGGTKVVQRNKHLHSDDKFNYFDYENLDLKDFSNFKEKVCFLKAAEIVMRYFARG